MTQMFMTKMFGARAEVRESGAQRMADVCQVHAKKKRKGAKKTGWQKKSSRGEIVLGTCG